MTAQFRECLLLEGQPCSLACTPPIPVSHPRIIQLSEEEAAESCEWVFSSACWRRYIGHWEIQAGRLYLKSVAGIYRLQDDEPVFADWYSGTLIIPTGPMTEYVHQGFFSRYERELRIDIHQGCVTGWREPSPESLIKKPDEDTDRMGFIDKLIWSAVLLFVLWKILRWWFPILLR